MSAALRVARALAPHVFAMAALAGIVVAYVQGEREAAEPEPAPIVHVRIDGSTGDVESVDVIDAWS